MSPNVSRRDNQGLQAILKSGLAGGVAGCVAKTVVAPLDRVKILFQASNPEFQKYAGTWSGAFKAAGAIYKVGGFRDLLQGHSATLLRVFPYAAIKFMAYDQVHNILMPTPAQETNFRRFSAGAISGMISVFFTYPLEVIRVRMAFHTRGPEEVVEKLRPSFTRAARFMYRETATSTHQTLPIDTNTILNRYPLLKFYRGFTVTIIGMIPYAGVSFLCWGALRARFVSRDASGYQKKPTPLADLGIGAVSGVLAQTASYPFEVVRRRMQVGGITQPDRWLRWGETAKTIWQSKGLRGFYVGLSIGYLKIVPMTAVSYAVWQGGKQLMGV
ncbi:hypothetical protein HGRIS_002389 [Hohenbuehelia grisea]|uniref:Mitochondrial carrier protein n=1 Tax=Hohenbuehelia grisea TaxID=104357 RepID=A0ABR3JLG3_9AGAR